MDTRTRNVMVAGAVAVLLSVGIVAVDAAADDSSGATGTAGSPATSLVLTITPQGGVAHSVTLTCPAGGTHPNPQGACEALDAANGNIGSVPAKAGQMCPHIVRPVTASASGTYQGRPESYMRTFNNQCELNRATNPIFAF